jgi:hypothetical protein
MDDAAATEASPRTPERQTEPLRHGQSSGGPPQHVQKRFLCRMIAREVCVDYMG